MNIIKYTLLFLLLISPLSASEQIPLHEQFNRIVDKRVSERYIGRTVGYRPIVSSFPDGSSLSVGAIISHNRRYVRTSFPTSFMFGGVTEVKTFNFVTGQSQ